MIYFFKNGLLAFLYLKNILFRILAYSINPYSNSESDWLNPLDNSFKMYCLAPYNGTRLKLAQNGS